MHNSDDWQPGGGRGGRVIAAVAVTVAVLFVLLHLAGVFGP
jgi:hypothetical protein